MKRSFGLVAIVIGIILLATTPAFYFMKGYMSDASSNNGIFAKIKVVFDLCLPFILIGLGTYFAHDGMTLKKRLFNMALIPVILVVGLTIAFFILRILGYL